jgi:DNA-binding SARP family transcriptional activator
MRIYNGKPLLSERDLIHPREHERQSLYRGYFFGQFRIFHQERPLGELVRRRNKAGMLLKWFLLNPGKLGSADEFIDLFWPEVSSKTALGNFHVTMHYLRRMLEPALKERQESAFIRRKPNNFYWFQVNENWWTDTGNVQNLFDRARKYELLGEDTKAAFYYRQVANYCSLGFLPEDTSEDWLLPYRQLYEHIYSQVLMRLIQLYTQRNDLEEVLEYAYQSLQVDPCGEMAIKAIVNVHLQRGNVLQAQRLLDTFWDSFERDLGFHPGKEFHALRERIFAANE